MKVRRLTSEKYCTIAEIGIRKTLDADIFRYFTQRDLSEIFDEKKLVGFLSLKPIISSVRRDYP